MRPEHIARICHEVNRAYCQALGDNSQPAWEDAPQWQKDSAMMGVKLHTENPDAGPQASHESWMAQKVAEGWQWGQRKLPEVKQHPCIVPFEQLSREQQAKDYIFRAVVHATEDAASDELAAARQRIAYLEEELRNQQGGALLYIAAIVERAVGVGVTMTLSELDMTRAYDLTLERGDTKDGGMAVRVLRRPAEVEQPAPQSAIITELNPVLAKAQRPIILLDTARPPGE